MKLINIAQFTHISNGVFFMFVICKINSWWVMYKLFCSTKLGGQFNSEIDGQFQFQNWNCLFLKMELELINLELKFATKKLNPQINWAFNFLSEIFLPWQSYLEYKLLGVGIQSRYSKYLLQSVIGVGKKWNCNW